MATKTIRNTKANRAKAIAELGFNVPYYRCRVAGSRLEFHLYGGQVLQWPPDPDPDPVVARRPQADACPDAGRTSTPNHEEGDNE